MSGTELVKTPGRWSGTAAKEKGVKPRVLPRSPEPEPDVPFFSLGESFLAMASGASIESVHSQSSWIFSKAELVMLDPIR